MADEAQRTGGEEAGGGSASIDFGTTPTDGTAGSIVFLGTAGVMQEDNANLFYNVTDKIVYVGANSGALTGTKGHFQSTVNSYSQVNSTNKSNGGSASSDWVATADTGNDTTNYIDMGINSSGYNDAAYTIGTALSGYIYTNGAAPFAIGTQTNNAAASIVFHTAGTLVANKRMEITSTGLVNIGTAAVNVTANGLVRIGVSGGSIIDIGPGGTGGSSIWMGTSVTPTTTNYAISASATSTAIQGSTNVTINAGSTVKANFSTTFTFTPPATASGALSMFTFTTPLSTAQTAGTEQIAFDFDMDTNTVQHASNTTIALNRDVLISGRTHRFASATGTITRAVTVSVVGSPLIGTNAAITTAIGLEVESMSVNAGTTYGAFINAMTGSGANYALGLAAGTTTTAPLRLLSGTNLTTAVAGVFEYNGTNLFFTRTGTTRESVVCGVINVATYAVLDTTKALVVNVGGVSYNIQLVN